MRLRIVLDKRDFLETHIGLAAHVNGALGFEPVMNPD